MRTLALALLIAAPLASQAPYERIVNADREPGQWLTYSGHYSGRRHSLLKQITRENVGSLKPVWIYQIDRRDKFETTPLVIDGVMYITEPPSNVTAIDVRTGRALWNYRRGIPEGILAC